MRDAEGLASALRVPVRLPEHAGDGDRDDVPEAVRVELGVTLPVELAVLDAEAVPDAVMPCGPELLCVIEGTDDGEPVDVTDPVGDSGVEREDVDDSVGRCDNVAAPLGLGEVD